MKTTIKTLLVLSLFVFANTLCAQNPLSLGVSAGLNLSDYAGDMEDNKIKAGFNAGITVDYRLSRYIYLMTGLEVNSKGTKVKGEIYVEDIGWGGIEPATSPAKYKQTFNPIYLQIPIHAGYVLDMDDMKFLVHAGPYVAYGIGGKLSAETEMDGYETQKGKTNIFGKNRMLKRWDFGMGLGIGYQFREIGVNFGYDLGILDLYGGPGKLKNNNAHISFGYRFQLL